MINTKTASEIYLLSLQSKQSRVTMGNTLKLVANLMQGVPTHEECDWSKLSYESVLSLMSHLKESNLSPARMNTFLAAIKGTAKQASRMKLIDFETYQAIKDCDRITGERADSGRSLVNGELSKLISHCKSKNTIVGTRDAAILSTLYSGGLRRQELVNLKLSDINFESNELLVSGKGNKERVTVINDKGISLLREYVRVRGSEEGFLFSRCLKGGKFAKTGISTQTVYNVVCNNAVEMGLPKLSCHDFRRSFCTTLLESNVDVFTVSRLMGHANASTTQSYDKRGVSERNRASSALSF